jgi:hypothetical protein
MDDFNKHEQKTIQKTKSLAIPAMIIIGMGGLLAMILSVGSASAPYLGCGSGVRVPIPCEAYSETEFQSCFGQPPEGVCAKYDKNNDGTISLQDLAQVSEIIYSCTLISCGNGIIEPGEQCEGTNLNGESCTSLGYTSGSLSCNGSCQIDTTGCVGSSYSMNLSLCNDDGVTETPSFASGRDSNNCLMIDPGNGDPAVPFQYEQFHKTGIAVGCNKVSPLPGTTVIEHNLNSYSRCSTKDAGEYCSMLFWDTTFDNYIDPACKNEDVMTLERPLEYVYFKNASLLNTWKCNQESGTFKDWDGPNGIHCDAGEDSSSHVDGLQLRQVPVNGGWFVMQDSRFLNGLNLHFLHQVQSGYGPNGSVMFQGVEFGRKASVGAATDWINDCKTLNPQLPSDGDICNEGRTLITYSAPEYWLVNVFGTARFKLRGAHDKIVIVNTGCGPSGCNGTIAYHNGYPHPLYGGDVATGPGTCPNGSIGQCTAQVEPCYCYTSVEAAAADGHKLPPFIQHSAAGWENPVVLGATTDVQPEIILERSPYTLSLINRIGSKVIEILVPIFN